MDFNSSGVMRGRSIICKDWLALSFPLADGTALHCPAAQGFAHHLGRLAVGGKAAEDGKLHIVYDNFRPLLAVILLQLPQALDDGDDAQAPGAAGGEHHFSGLNFWQ